MNKEISIIVVNYNSYKYLQKLLPFIDLKFKFLNKETIILDNSQDKNDFNQIKINDETKNIFLNQNLGFAKANNIGISYSNSEYILFLNPDTLTTEDFVTPIISFIKKNPEAAACAPMLVYENGDYQNSSGPQMGFWYEFMEAFFLISLHRKLFYLFKVKNNIKPVKVGWVSAACMIIKRNIFDKVGGFTEDYFLNYEDIDLCKKISDEGYINYYFPALKCIHLDHKSFDKNYELLVLTRYKSRLIYSSKHYNILTRLSARFMHIISICIRLLFVNLTHRGIERRSRAKGYWKALVMYLGI
ncbi:MAG: glycosyltransferase family 2 protein [Ignavibacteriae bacterium]|nr:MAG: glycosyltransferase family 2 protein [Ignavibacteriota bacterium]